MCWHFLARWHKDCSGKAGLLKACDRGNTRNWRGFQAVIVSARKAAVPGFCKPSVVGSSPTTGSRLIARHIQASPAAAKHPEALRISGQAVAAHFQTRDAVSTESLFEIKPEQFVPVIRLDRQDRRRHHLFLWDLIPHREKTFTEIYVTPRSETVDQKRAFREASLPRTNRWLLCPVRTSRRPHLFTSPRPALRLWERWLGEDGKGIRTCPLGSGCPD